MKYTTKVASKQAIWIDEKTAVIIDPKGGSITDERAKAVAETKWGKRLIEAGLLAFEKSPEKKTDGEEIPDFDGEKQ
jgi:hypothetical protein